VNEYFTDLIDIVIDSYDKNGAKTGTSTQLVPCRIEDKNRMVKNKDGQEVASNAFLMVDINATLAYNARVIFKSQCGAPTIQPAKERAILKLGKAHGFDGEYWQVWV